MGTTWIIKDYDQYIYLDSRSEAEPSVTGRADNYMHEINSYVFQKGISSTLPDKLDELEQSIVADPELTEKEVHIIQSDIMLWKYLSDNKNFMKLYDEQIVSENSRGVLTYLECTAYSLKFGVNFTLCILGKIPSCLKLPSDVFSAIEKCKKIFRKKPKTDPCAGSNDPCCGVFCSQGYRCANGKCVKDLVNDPCDKCRPGEQCFNGTCAPL